LGKDTTVIWQFQSLFQATRKLATSTETLRRFCRRRGANILDGLVDGAAFYSRVAVRKARASFVTKSEQAQ